MAFSLTEDGQKISVVAKVDKSLVDSGFKALDWIGKVCEVAGISAFSYRVSGLILDFKAVVEVAKINKLKLHATKSRELTTPSRSHKSSQSFRLKTKRCCVPPKYEVVIFIPS